MENKYLIIGGCGVGKTWIMKSIIKHLNLTENKAVGLLQFTTNGKVIVTGKYDGSVFEGSDKLSMAVMRDVGAFLEQHNNTLTFFEGDRFTNGNFIKIANPIILKVGGDGKIGREQRGTQQSNSQIVAIRTRVSNIQYDYSFENSQQCYDFILTILNGGVPQRKIKLTQESLF